MPRKQRHLTAMTIAQPEMAQVASSNLFLILEAITQFFFTFAVRQRQNAFKTAFPQPTF